MNPDPARYYNLESYLLTEVCKRFDSEGSIGAFDFFSIVIWKANRAKSRIAERLRKIERLRKNDSHITALEPIVQGLTRSLHDADDGQARLRILVGEWGFMLPMATAILSILWPEEFTVYDVRVCGQLKALDNLKAFDNLDNLGSFEKKWKRYCEYRDAVRAAVPKESSLRNKDRYLWARSAIQQLEADIAAGFVRRSDA